MIIRYAVPLKLKVLQNKVDYDGFEETKEKLNRWFTKKISRIKKPIKNVTFLCNRFDLDKFAIGMGIEFEE